MYINLPERGQKGRHFQIESEIATSILQYIEPTLNFDDRNLSQEQFDGFIQNSNILESEFTINEFNEKFTQACQGRYDLDSFIIEVAERSILRAAILTNTIIKSREYDGIAPYDLYTNTLQEIILCTYDLLLAHTNGDLLQNPYVQISVDCTQRISHRFANYGIRRRLKKERIIPDEVYPDEKLRPLYNSIIFDEQQDQRMIKFRDFLLKFKPNISYKYFALIAKRALQDKNWETVSYELGMDRKEASKLFRNLKIELNS